LKKTMEKPWKIEEHNDKIEENYGKKWRKLW
jgi:hypothetical protein